MRKLTILVALLVVTANSGCTRCCIGRCRNLFHKGSPCGTTMAPAVLGAPLAMGTPLATPVAQPMMAQPMMAQPMMTAPVCVEPAAVCPQMCVPCDPCDPCGGGSVSMGYGGYGSEGCGCDGSTSAPMAIESSGTPIQAGQTLPGPTP